MSRERSQVRVADVAREAKVSTATVSRVMAGIPTVSAATRARVLAAAEKIGFRPNLAARVLRTGRPEEVAFIACSSVCITEFGGQLLVGFQSVVEAHGLRAVVVFHPEGTAAQDRVEELLRAGWCSAAAIHTSVVSDAARLTALGVPVVLLEHPSGADGQPPAFDTMGFDMAGSFRLAACYLSMVGHSAIGLLRPPAGHPMAEVCEAGFRAGMAESGLAIRPGWIADCPMESGMDGGANAVGRLLSSAQQPLTALVCASDTIALGVIAEAQRWGRSVPRDLSVVGCDDHTWARLMNPPLTTIVRNGWELGCAAARRLLALRDNPALAPERVIVPVWLAVRGSTSPRAETPALVPDAQFPATGRGQRFGVEVGDAVQPPLADGLYEFVALHSGMCFDLPYASASPGTGFWQAPANGMAAQLWLVTHVGGGWCRIRSAASMLVAEDSAEHGVRQTATPSDSALWRFECCGDAADVVRICNKASGRILEVAGGSCESAARIVAGQSGGEPGQQWRAVPVPLMNGNYELLAGHTSMVLEERGGGSAPAVCVGPALGTQEGRVWQFLHEAHGCYRIRNVHSGLLLEAPPGDPAAVAVNGPQWDSPEYQLWKPVPVRPEASLYRVMNMGDKRCLEDVGGGAVEGSAVKTAEPSDAPHQQWVIRPA